MAYYPRGYEYMPRGGYGYDTGYPVPVYESYYGGSPYYSSHGRSHHVNIPYPIIKFKSY